MTIRPYVDDDAEALADLCRASIMDLGRAAYDEAQLAAWASFPDDIPAFRARLARSSALVAVVDDQTAGVGSLDLPDHIDLLYTSPRFSRRGVATHILCELESHARDSGQTRVHAEASLLARPLFAKRGYRVDAPEESEYGGMLFTRFRMSKQLPSHASP